MFLLHAVEVVDTLGDTHPLLPAVAETGVLGGILDTHLGVLFLVFVVDVEHLTTQVDGDGVDEVGFLVDGHGGQVFVGAGGIAEHEGEVAFFGAFQRDVEVLSGLVGHVVLVVHCRMAVLVGIDAEDAEVARVAGPHPVVGVAAELANVARRAAHKAHVGIDLIEQQVVFVAQEEGLDADFVFRLLLDVGNDLLDVGVDFGLTVGFSHVVGDAVQHLCRHVAHLTQEDDAEAGAGQLLAPVHGPEAVGEVVVLHRAVFLYVVIAAVVVGEQQALVADDFAGAAAAKEDDGVFQAAVVDAVDVVSGDFYAHLLHLFLVVLQQHGNPHAFASEEEGRDKDQKGRQ